MSTICDLLAGLSSEVMVFMACLSKRRRDDLLESLHRHGAEEVDDKIVLASYAANWGIHPQYLQLFSRYMS